MRVLVTGATGWVGSAVVRELLQAGHSVVGLVRSELKIQGLSEQGAIPLVGSLDDLERLQRAAMQVDAVVHTAFNHDFSRFVENCEQDRRAIEALGAALEGSSKPLLVTSGVAHLAQGRAAVEGDVPQDVPGYPRRSEAAARALAARGVRVGVVRLAPTVHGVGDHGFIPGLIRLARETGVSAYLQEGANLWPAVHRLDAARLYRLALESGVEQPVYHAIAEEGIPFREIAAAIARGLDLPLEARGADHFGWFAAFAGMDVAASSERTRRALGWVPEYPGLLEDLAGSAYF